MGQTRRDFRVPVRIGATVAFEWGGGAKALVSDVSRSGMSFTVLRRDLPFSLPMGGLAKATTVRLSFQLDGAPIEAVGRIAWVRMTASADRPDRVTAGIAIDAFSAEVRRTWLEWLQGAIATLAQVANSALTESWEAAAAGLVRLGWRSPGPGAALMALRYASRYGAAERVS